jgi:membrane-bound metal-dependent hydrolase YbcI (DUF457 family)
MFIGHFGLSLAAKKAAPKVSLGVLFAATQFVDLLWPFFLLFKVEKVTVIPGYTETNAFNFQHYPYSHSLLMGIVWGILFGIIYYLFKKDKRGALVAGLCVLSHWFFDLVVHTADLPLTPFGNTKAGLGLWNHRTVTLILETAIFLAGTYIYATFTKPKNKIGNWGFWILIALLTVFNLGNTFGPAPSDDINSLAVSSIGAMVLLLVFAHWVDRNRELKIDPS